MINKLWEHNKLSNQNKTLAESNNYSILDPAVRTILDFCGHYKAFHRKVSSIHRYDFLLNELRTEQQIGNKSTLTKTGNNMPSILRRIHEDEGSWSSLQSTLKDIAPHIFDAKSDHLKTGKEFIEFIESKTGRGVEAWDSSDGSLRALAILLAIETTREGETMVLEEPEQNLHPWAIAILMKHIERVIKEKKIQVIMTTHSEHVLTCCSPSSVKVIQRNQESGTYIVPLEDIVGPDVQMGDVGRLWIKGLLGGVPEYA